MNRLFVASLFSLALASGSAVAADLGVAPIYKAPPPPAATWTGCYIDGGGGYGVSNVDHNLETLPGRVALSGTTTDGGRGWLGRAGGGCDLQFTAPIFNMNAVIGVFGDYDFSHINGTFSDPANGLGGGLNQSSAWNVGARAGVLVTPSLLTYFDGGFTQARFGQTNLSTFGAPVQVPSPFALSANNFNGWFIGGGTEYAVTWLPIPGIFWRNEYRYSTYNSADVPVITAATGAATAFGQHMQPQVQTITTSLVWRFNFLNH